MTDNKINVTLKAGEGFAAPWVTIGGDSEAEAAFNLKAVIGVATPDADFFALVTQAASALKGFYVASDQLGATAVNAAAVQQYQAAAAAPAFQPSTPGPGRWETPPAATAPQWAQPPAPAQAGPPAAQCVHGAMVFRSGSKNGRDWSGSFCPTPKGTQGQCAPVFGA